MIQRIDSQLASNNIQTQTIHFNTAIIYSEIIKTNQNNKIHVRTLVVNDMFPQHHNANKISLE